MKTNQEIKEQYENILKNRLSNGTAMEYPEVVDLFLSLREQELTELEGEILNIIGEDIPKDQQMAEFDRWHVQLENGKYLQRCSECSNHKHILEILALIASKHTK